MKLHFIFLLVPLMPGIGFVALGAEVSTNALAPGVPWNANELKSVQMAASNSLAGFRKHITAANYKLMGFDSPTEVLAATNGSPLMIFTVRLSQLTNYQAGNDFNVLLEPPSPPSVIVPIMVGPNVKSSTTLRASQGVPGTPAHWVGPDWGRPTVIRNLTATLSAIPDLEVRPGTVPFAVAVPVPRILLVGYYNNQNKLVLRSTIDLHIGPITINRYQVVTTDAMQQLSIYARRYNPDLPD
jgi:hypothetical protein